MSSLSADTESEVDKSIGDIDKQINQLQEEINRLSRKKKKLEDQKSHIKEQKYLQKSFELSNKDWDKESFAWSTNVRAVLKDTFKMKDFRPQQLRTINAIMSGNDVLFVAPTGGGKSLCFQLPAVLTPGLTVVISPLISLMEDQVESVKRFKIEAALLCQSTDKALEKTIYQRLIHHDFASPLKLLYITPERMSKSKRFMSALQKCYLAKNLDRFAIDEVHCCSQWGHDFRPDYKFLGSLKTTFPDVPILGVTATATNKVVMDVQKMLSIKHSLVIKAPFNRPNLFYQVMEKPSEKQATVDLIADLLKTRYLNQSGIIYTHSIKDAEELCASLLNVDIKVRPYHASLDPNNRTRIHKKWLAGQIQAVVATVAFGMGIDKPDVRFVIHHTMSKSVENLYQESGRAGRDGKPAECLVMFRFQDLFKVSTMMFSEHTGLQNAYEVLRYCVNGDTCRRKLISKYFAEVWKDDHCGRMCDHCYYLEAEGEPPEILVDEYAIELQQIIRQADGLDMKLTAIKLIDAWYRKGPVALHVKSKQPPALDRSYAEQIIAYCLLQGLLQEDFHYTAYKTNSYFKVGPESPTGDEMLKLNKNRYRDLPPLEDMPKRCATDDIVIADDEDDEEIVFVAETPSGSTPHKKRKKHKRNGVDGSETDDSCKKRRRHKQNMLTENLVVKEEIFLDDEIEMVDDKSILIEIND